MCPCSPRNSLVISLKPSLSSLTDLAVRDTDLCEICANAACAGCFWTTIQRRCVKLGSFCIHIARSYTFTNQYLGSISTTVKLELLADVDIPGPLLEWLDQVSPAVQFWQQGDCKPHLGGFSSAWAVSHWNENVLGTVSFSTSLSGLEHNRWTWALSCSLFNI